MKNKLILLLAALLLCTLAACGETEAPPEGESGVTVFPVTAMPLEDPLPSSYYSEGVGEVTLTSTVFAFDFARLLHGDESTENFICSPYSVWLPLAALLNAAEGADLDALHDALALYESITVEDVNHAASRSLYWLTNEREREWLASEGEEATFVPPLRVANAIFLQEGLTPKTDFLQSFADFYRGQAFAVDFSDPAAVDVVNDWASEHTAGLIPEIVQEFSSDTVLSLANAVYYASRWIWEFDPTQTRENVFYAPSGETTAQFMYKQGDGLDYYEDEDQTVQAIRLPMREAGALYVILPHDGEAGALLEGMDWEYFLMQIRDQCSERTGTLLLPRFRVESDVMHLEETLEAMGVPFFESSPMGGIVEEEVFAPISTVVQKALIEVDEKGTTAAAVTVMEMDGGIGPEPTEPFEMVCNRPFIFVLTARAYAEEQVLFVGVVNDPNAG